MGQLRSLLGERALRRRHDALLLLLEEARASDPMRYDDQWLPYLRGYARKLPSPVRVKGLPQRCDRVAACLPFANLHLILPEHLVDHDIERLSKEPLSEAITALTIESHQVSSQGLLFLAGAAWYPQLDFLRLDSDRFGIAGFEAFLSQIQADTLKGIELATRHLNGRVIERIFACPPIAHVEHLSLSGHALADTFELLLDLLSSLTLRSLGLPGCNLDADALLALLQTPWFRELERVDLSRNLLDVRAARHLSGEHRRFEKLKTIDLSRNSFGNAGLQEVLDFTVFPDTCHVDLCHNGITFGGLELYATHPRRGRVDVEEDTYGSLVHLFTVFGWLDPEQPLAGLSDLSELIPDRELLREDFELLDLRGQNLTDKECEVLAGLTALEFVRYLDISENRITDDGFALLADSPFLTQLEHIDVRGNPLSSWGLLYLTRSVNLTSLRELEFVDEDHQMGRYPSEQHEICMALLDPEREVALVFDRYERGYPHWQLFIDGEECLFYIEHQAEFAYGGEEMPQKFPASLQVDELAYVGDIRRSFFSLFDRGVPLTHIRTLRMFQTYLGTCSPIMYLLERGFSFENLDLRRAGISVSYRNYYEPEPLFDITRLAECDTALRLQRIDLSQNGYLDLTDEDIDALIESSNLANLRELILPYRSISDANLARLREARPLLDVSVGG